MFGKKEFDAVDKFDTLIGAGSVFEGNIKSDGTIRIDGKIVGDLTINGDVYISPGANIKGNINANNIHNAGTVDGNIQANGILRLLPTSKINGDIIVESFIADEGGVFNGKCTMKTENKGAKS